MSNTAKSVASVHEAPQPLSDSSSSNNFKAIQATDSDAGASRPMEILEKTSDVSMGSMSKSPVPMELDSEKSTSPTAVEGAASIMGAGMQPSATPLSAMQNLLHGLLQDHDKACDYHITFEKLKERACLFYSLPGNGQNDFPKGLANDILREYFHKEEVEQFANDTYIILHRRSLDLIAKFLDFKKTWGTPREKEVYHSLNEVTFITRLLRNRPFCFVGEEDSYLLRNGVSGFGGFDNLPNSSKTDPINLDEYISYDEMPISALLGVSVHTHFVNSGSRQNRGIAGPEGSFQREGIYTGLVGARFEREGLMEWQHMIITEKQNTKDNGFGKDRVDSPAAKLLGVWAQFYQCNHDERGYFFPSYDEVRALPPEKQTAHEIYPTYEGSKDFFNARVFKLRIRAILVPFLCDANFRSEKEHKHGYVHLVGLGLGVWQLSDLQVGGCA